MENFPYTWGPLFTVFRVPISHKVIKTVLFHHSDIRHKKEMAN